MSFSKPESVTVRSQLKLRKNPHSGTWEVWSTIAGQGYFRWLVISEETKSWYVATFNTPIVAFDEPFTGER